MKIRTVVSVIAFCVGALISATPVFADTPSPTTTVSTIEVKLPILVDSAQMSLYVYDIDQPGVSNCTGGCARAWPPLLHSGAAPQAPFSIIQRKDGTSQLAYKGHPLYTYVGDSQPGDITGDGLGGVWHLIVNPSLN